MVWREAHLFCTIHKAFHAADKKAAEVCERQEVTPELFLRKQLSQ